MFLGIGNIINKYFRINFLGRLSTKNDLSSIQLGSIDTF